MSEAPLNKRDEQLTSLAGVSCIGHVYRDAAFSHLAAIVLNGSHADRPPTLFQVIGLTRLN